MDREKFLALVPARKIEEVNDMLKRSTLKEIANMLGYAYSTFTTEMRNGGEYQYNKKNKQYVRVESMGIDSKEEGEVSVFIKENMESLKHLIERYKSNQLLLLDGRIYSNRAKFESKTIKMNEEVYETFSNFCKENYPQFKTQDLIAQALLDFTRKYRR
ncbi:hypothetical protein [Radiobacillus deserti]|uniref:Uncharacterized protein n=1 Tax=Radiobacillus deserti TaxID=2594883 RepID=A0A516KD66_9BACI|nr:hypothetical protein [Radiobacillus deserti]QDP39363.1 hypothetical protein FN924_03655 [Radiobacillus deserti]